MRLINADTLKENIEQYKTVHLSHRRLSAIKREAEEVINDIYFAIDVSSTIDPVKHGRWIEIDDHYLCGNCGAAYHGVDLNYCPNCGARMDEVDDDT